MEILRAALRIGARAVARAGAVGGRGLGGCAGRVVGRRAGERGAVGVGRHGVQAGDEGGEGGGGAGGQGGHADDGEGGGGDLAHGDGAGDEVGGRGGGGGVEGARAVGHVGAVEAAPVPVEGGEGRGVRGGRGLEARVFEEEHAGVAHDAVGGERGDVHGDRAGGGVGKWHAHVHFEALGAAAAEHGEHGADFLQRDAGEAVHALALELGEDAVGLLDQPLVQVVARLPRVQDENHARVERLLAHGPADQHGGAAVVEEEERLQNVHRRVDDQRASADRGRVERGRRGAVPARGGVAGLRALHALPIEEDEKRLHFRKQRWCTRSASVGHADARVTYSPTWPPAAIPAAA